MFKKAVYRKPKASQSVFAFMMLFLLFGCKPDQVTSAIILNDRCAPPCWQNIYPGQTSKEEALSILTGVPSVDSSSISTHGGPWNIFEDIVYSTFQSNKIKAKIFIMEGNVVMIEFSGSISITFNTAIKEIGEPKNVINIPLSGGVPLAPTPSSAIIALNPQKGVSFSYDTRDLPKEKQSEVSPDIQLNLVTFFDPDTYEKLLDARIFSIGFLDGKDTLFYMKPWTGFGLIREKYPPASIR